MDYEGSKAFELVRSQNWEYREGTPPNIELETCPFCLKTGYGHLYLECHGNDSPKRNRDGLFMCQRCGKNGNLYTLKQLLGISTQQTATTTKKGPEALPDIDKCCEALLADVDGLDYLMNERGFSLDIIRQQRIGLTSHYFRETGEVRALVYPFLVGGNAVWAHYRTLPTMPLSENRVVKAFSSPSGYDAVLYNGEIIREGIKEVCLVEGEADCIAALDKGVIDVCGVPGANIKKAMWISQLDALDLKVFICYDSDKVGQKAAQTLASRIGVERCYKITLPEFTIETEDGYRKGKDLNEWFAKAGGTAELFQQLRDKAVLFDVDGVASATTAMNELVEDFLDKGTIEPKYVSPWPALNKFVGFEDGDVIDILAPEKIGKTTFGMNLLEGIVNSYGDDAMIICLEMTVPRMARKYLAMMADIADDAPDDAIAAINLLHKFANANLRLQSELANRKGHLYFCYPKYKTCEDIYGLIRDCIRRYGVKWVMLDNIQRLSDTTIGNKQRTQHLSEISKVTSQIAKDYNVQMVRILQPHRIQADKMVTTDDVDGASQIAKDCDCMITLHRERITVSKGEFETVGYSQSDAGKGTFKDTMLVTVGLSRYSAGGFTTLNYDGARSRVSDVTGEDKVAMLEKATSKVGYQKQMDDAGITAFAQATVPVVDSVTV